MSFPGGDPVEGQALDRQIVVRLASIAEVSQPNETMEIFAADAEPRSECCPRLAARNFVYLGVEQWFRMVPLRRTDFNVVEQAVGRAERQLTHSC
jgi:hypothetical protein